MPCPRLPPNRAGDVYEYTWEKAMVYLDTKEDGKPVTKYLSRPYARVDREKFKTKLLKMCQDGGVKFLKSIMQEVEHQGPTSRIRCANG